MILFFKCYLIILIFIQLIYTFRQIYFCYNRTRGEQQLPYHKIMDSDLPMMTVFIPMHNEEKVAENILNQLMTCEYPRDKLEIIPISDHSTDDTETILNRYAAKYPTLIKPLHRNTGIPGKAGALNAGLEVAKGEILTVFDADYLMPQNILKKIAVSFKDPSVAAVMGRVVPINSSTNLLTRLLELERTGGYQVDQQARYNLNLIPQYGGTAGALRKDLVIKSGGFNPHILAEDTELTFRFYTNGWKVVYSNDIYCYEEVPADWAVRGNQVRRWSRGHNQTLFNYLIPFLRSPYVSLPAKLDGICLLGVYFAPFLLLLGIFALFALMAYGEMQIVATAFGFLIFAAFCSFGNFAPFYQINVGTYIDKTTYRITLLPFLCFAVLFNLVCITKGLFDAFIDIWTKRHPTWIKTKRYFNQEKTS